MSQHYSDPRREQDPGALPDLEVFEAPWARQCDGCGFVDLDADATECECDDFEDHSWTTVAGWFYWPCLPGCLPDGDAVGPFETEAEALEDAREGMEG